MNILYIHTHDMGRFIQPYGHAIDPLLAGYVPKPAGARVNFKWALHPNEWEFE